MCAGRIGDHFGHVIKPISEMSDELDINSIEALAERLQKDVRMIAQEIEMEEAELNEMQQKCTMLQEQMTKKREGIKSAGDLRNDLNKHRQSYSAIASAGSEASHQMRIVETVAIRKLESDAN